MVLSSWSGLSEGVSRESGGVVRRAEVRAVAPEGAERPICRAPPCTVAIGEIGRRAFIIGSGWAEGYRGTASLQPTPADVGVVPVGNWSGADREAATVDRRRRRAYPEPPNHGDGSSPSLQRSRHSTMGGWCMRSVRAWADLRGFEYAFVDRAFFEGVPEWYAERAGTVVRGICLLADLARLQWARKLLELGHERVIWFDADVLVFRPEGLTISRRPLCAFTEEFWVTRASTGHRPMRGCTVRAPPGMRGSSR